MHRAILAIATFVGTSLLAAIAAVIIQGGFGAGDLFAFTLWTAMLSVPFLPLLAGFARLSGAWGWQKAFLGAAMLGILTSVGIVLLVATILGPWFGAFSFSPFTAWLAGGIASFFLTAALPRPDHRRRAVYIGVSTYGATVIGLWMLASFLG
jgi:hypothetical protein